MAGEPEDVEPIQFVFVNVDPKDRIEFLKAIDELYKAMGGDGLVIQSYTVERDGKVCRLNDDTGMRIDEIPPIEG